VNRARLVIFADQRIYIGPFLARTFVEAANARGDVEVVAVCDSAPTSFGPSAAAQALAARLARRAFDAAHPIVRRPSFARLGAFLRQRGIPHLVPPARNVNADAFVHRALPALRPDFALSLICLQVFRAPLLAAFQRAVNYHPGVLPAYRGLNPTAWSLYRGEPLTGFSYHLMTETIDQGPVVVSGAAPVASGASVAELEWAKTRLAAACANRVLDALVRDERGVAQSGPAAYYGRAELKAVTTVGDPSTLSWNELVLRIRAFGRIRLRITGASVDVTRLRRQGARALRPGLAFVTADGIRAEVDRIGYLPPGLDRLVRTPEAG
jgi:folate-dependent phosphoribosylglycinamide formyltransferase PurN